MAASTPTRLALLLIGVFVGALCSPAESETASIPVARVNGAARTCALTTQHRSGAVATVAFDAMNQGALARQAASAGGKRVVLFLLDHNTMLAGGLATGRRLQDSFRGAGLVVYVDWGSFGKTHRYVRDAMAAERAMAHFRALLPDLNVALIGSELNVFGHGMGTRVVAELTVPVGEMIVQKAVIPASDVSLAEYARAVARIPKPFGNVTFYASRRDRALMLSMLVHFDGLLGRIADPRDILSRTDVVDATVASHEKDHGYAIYDGGVSPGIAVALPDSPLHATWKRLAKEPRTWSYQ